MTKHLIAAVWFFAIVLMPRYDADQNEGMPWSLVFDDEIAKILNSMDGVRPVWVPTKELEP